MSAPVSLWQRLLAWVRRVFSLRRQHRLSQANSKTALWPDDVNYLPTDLRASLDQLSRHTGVVRDTVASAICDYGHIHRIVGGHGESIDAVFDATLLADAEVTLREIVEGAPALQAVVRVASERRRDREGREAAGTAILLMQDRARVLSRAASAALQWSATPSGESQKRLRLAATRLSS